MPEPTVKGTSLNLTIDLVRQLHDEEGVERLIATLPPTIAEQVPSGRRFLPDQPYSMEIWGELLVAAEELFGTDFLRASSREGYRELLETTYRIWVREGDPLASLRGMPHLWDQVTSGLGDYEFVEESEEIFVRVCLHGVPARYRGISEERAAGTLEAMIAVSGGSGTVKRRPIEGGAELVILLEEPR